MPKPLIYNLREPQYSETYECFYCGTIVEDGEECPECKIESDIPQCLIDRAKQAGHREIDYRNRLRQIQKWFILAVLASLAVVLFVTYAHAETASFYTIESCLREGTSGIMANGRKLNDENLTCASWDYKFGTVLRITNLGNGKFCDVTVTDRGPNKRLYRMGRTIDLSKAAMAKLDGIRRGVIQIEVRRIK